MNEATKPKSLLLAALLSLIIPGLGQCYKGFVFGGFMWLFLILVSASFFLIPAIVLYVLCVLDAITPDGQ